MFADAKEAEELPWSAQATFDLSLADAFREASKRKRRGVVILGDPGSGKTTHLKRLLLSCLRQGAQDLGLKGDVIPVFLPLRDLRDLSKPLDAFIQQTLDSAHRQTSEGFGKRLLARGHLLLLFDGLDEVSDQVMTRTRVSVPRFSNCTCGH